MKIVFGCDPNATEFKLQLMDYVKGLGHEVADSLEVMIRFMRTQLLKLHRQLPVGKYDRVYRSMWNRNRSINCS